jgi:peroxiredoxin Q/BCP
MLKVGDKVPAFSLMSDTMGEVKSSALQGQRYVLYFYPKDDTPGCTKEACSFRDNLPKFQNVGVPIYGVSIDDVKAHGKFTKKFALNFPLLADPERKLIDGMGLWVEKSMYGRTYMGTARATFVVGPNGKVEHVWEKVTPEGHAEEVLAYLQGDAAGAAAEGAPKAPSKKTPKR